MLQIAINDFISIDDFNPLYDINNH